MFFRRKHRTHPRRRRSAGKYFVHEKSPSTQNCNSIDHVATAPTNTTQFIINDHNSPLPRGINGSPISACPTPTNSDGGGSRSRDGHEYDQIGDYYSSSRIPESSIEEQFAQEYSQFQYEKLSEMNREELIQKCIELEEALDCYDRVRFQHDGSSSESDFNSRPFTKHCSTCSCNIDHFVNCNSEYSSNESVHSGSGEEQQNSRGGHSSRGDTIIAADTTTKDVSPSKSNISPHSAASSPGRGCSRVGGGDDVGF